MVVFVVGAFLLMVTALMFVSWPFIQRRFRHRRELSEAEQREITNVALYEDHLADISRSLADGTLSQQEYDGLRIELERNLLEDSQNRLEDSQNRGGTAGLPQADEQQKPASYRWLFLGISIFLVVVSVGLYQKIGAAQAWQVKSILEAREAAQKDYFTTGNEAATSKIANLNHQLVTELPIYLEKHPEEIQMRALLARTLMSLGDYSPAIKQFQTILVQEPELSQVMAELAQAEFLKSENRVTPMVQSLVDQALAIEPNNPIALGLAGISAFQLEEYQKAITFWQKAIVLQGANSPNSRALQNGITAAKQRLAVSSVSASATSPAGLQAAEQAIEPQVTNDNKALDEAQVTVSVNLADTVKFSPGDTVFIYARAWQGAKIPLAITRVTADQLPLTVTLTNAMAMAPTMNLASADQWELVARLSSNGDPIAKAGDWQASVGPIASSLDNSLDNQLGSEKPPVILTISELIP